MQPLAVVDFTTTSAAGVGRVATARALRAERSGLTPNDLPWAPLDCWIGRVGEAESVTLPATLSDFDCRNNRLALLALEQDGFLAAVAAARARWGAGRIALFVGTSTSGILSTELAYQGRDPVTGRLPPEFRYDTVHNLDATTEFVRRVLGLAGPAMTVSTACSSSAKVFCLAERFIRLGLADAAVVGGVDSLCHTTLYGFNALQLVAPDVCRPYDAQRRGITIGEAGGFALLERGPGALALVGYGESSDAYHMSTPPPDGDGAQRAMREALARARLEPGQVDYINLHGSATAANDRAEGRAVHALFGDATPGSSTKGFTGHTLGAAGITEAAISLISLQQGFLAGSCTTREVDPQTRCSIALRGEARALGRVMSNSFGFGGNNCALVFGVAP